MVNCIITLGPINKKLLLPFLLALTQIIYIIVNEYYPEKKNDVVIHLFMLSFGQMSIKLLPFILKIGHEERTKEKFIKRKKCLNYFLLSLLLVIDASLNSAVDLLEVNLRHGKASYVQSNLFPHDNFIIMSIEMIFLICVSICLLKYKYYKHHIISLIIFTIFGIISEIFLGDFENMDGSYFIIKFIRILEVAANATFFCYQKYMMEKLYYPYWNIAFIPGIVMLSISGSLLIMALIDSNKENSTTSFIASFYSFYRESDTGLIIGKLIIDFVIHIILCPLSILVIFYFTPNFILIIFQLTRITKNLIDNSVDKLFCIVFYLIQFFALMIHLEILELNFCGLNKYTKRNIDRRGADDVLCQGRDSTAGLKIDVNKDYFIDGMIGVEMSCEDEGGDKENDENYE